MLLEEFIKLSLNDKANLVWRAGLFLDNHVEREKSFNLYFFPKFYVEVAVKNDDPGNIEIIGFLGGRRLDKYLKKIHLQELI
jgi:hypothetical protein